MIKKSILYVCTALLILACLSCEEIDVEDDGENPYKALELTTRSGEFVKMGSTFTFDFIERVDAVTEKEFGTIVMTTSLFEATSALLSPRTAPASTTSSRAFFANGSNFCSG